MFNHLNFYYSNYLILFNYLFLLINLLMILLKIYQSFIFQDLVNLIFNYFNHKFKKNCSS